MSKPKPKPVKIRADLVAMLKRYAKAENISLETAVYQFIRDGLEAA